MELPVLMPRASAWSAQHPLWGSSGRPSPPSWLPLLQRLGASLLCLGLRSAPDGFWGPGCPSPGASPVLAPVPWPLPEAQADLLLWPPPPAASAARWPEGWPVSQGTWPPAWVLRLAVGVLAERRARAQPVGWGPTGLMQYIFLSHDTSDTTCLLMVLEALCKVS